jgi:hypothetical protein
VRIEPSFHNLKDLFFGVARGGFSAAVAIRPFPLKSAQIRVPTLNLDVSLRF